MNINSVYAKTAIEALVMYHPDEFPNIETATTFVEQHSLEEIEAKSQIMEEVRRNLYSVFLALENINHRVSQEEMEKAWDEVLNGNGDNEPSLLKGYGDLLNERFAAPGFIEACLIECSHSFKIMQSQSGLDDIENHPEDAHQYLPICFIGVAEVLQKFNFLIPMLRTMGIEPNEQGLIKQHLYYQIMALEYLDVTSPERMVEFISRLGENFEALEFYSEEKKKLFQNPAFIKMIIEQLAERDPIFSFVKAAANPAIRTPLASERKVEESNKEPNNEVDSGAPRGITLKNADEILRAKEVPNDFRK